MHDAAGVPRERLATPEVRLIAPAVAQEEYAFPEDVTALMDAQARGVVRLRGPAGSGKTSALVEIACQRLAAGKPGNGLVIVTPGRDTASIVRRLFHQRLRALCSAQSRVVSDDAMVRTVHSLAFGILHSITRRLRETGPNADQPVELRLITGAEQDQVIREMLREDAEFPERWPADYHEALGTLSFARQLRDFLLRSLERGLGADDLERLGAQYQRPMWQAAARFLRQYQQIQALSGTWRLSAPEAINAVVGSIDPVRDASGIHTLLVDDAQNLDPAATRLIEKLLPVCELAVIAGDEDQSVFHFRGASATLMSKTRVDSEVRLTETHRAPDRHVHLCDSVSHEVVAVADAVQRAHLIDGVAYSDIAVISRTGSQVHSLRRALAVAGVPVRAPQSSMVLVEHAIVLGFLKALDGLVRPLRPSECEQVLVGPVGGVEPAVLNRVMRTVRSHGVTPAELWDAIRDCLYGVMAEEDASSTSLREFFAAHGADEHDVACFARAETAIAQARAAHRNGASAEEVLWELWQGSGLATILKTEALRGGALGAQAHTDLDAMMALFDAAGDFVEANPTAGVASFVRHIREQELATSVRQRRGVVPEAVTVLKAHQTVGQQWDTVVVAGVNEEHWPAMGVTGSLFEQDRLLDLIDQTIDPDIPINRSREILEEERRLFHLACARATRRLVVTAVGTCLQKDEDPSRPGMRNEEAEPSRFLDELGVRPTIVTLPSPEGEGEHPGDAENSGGSPADPNELYRRRPLRHLSRSAVIGELRHALAHPDTAPEVRDHAALLLARLARAGVPGANPEQWWAGTEPSTTEPPIGRARGAASGAGGDAPVIRLSPSRVALLEKAPVVAVLRTLVEDSEFSLHLARGSLAHAYAEALAKGLRPTQARKLVVDAFKECLGSEPACTHPSLLAKFDYLLDRIESWIQDRARDYDLVATEHKFEVTIPPGSSANDSEPGVRLVGRIDRIDRHRGSGLITVIDFKTGSTVMSVAEAAKDPQLRCYQFALWATLADGAQDEVLGSLNGEPWKSYLDHAELVYPASETKSISTRKQDVLEESELRDFREHLRDLANLTRQPQLPVTFEGGSRECEVCKAFADLCPVHGDPGGTCDRNDEFDLMGEALAALELIKRNSRNSMEATCDDQ